MNVLFFQKPRSEGIMAKVVKAKIYRPRSKAQKPAQDNPKG